MAFGFIYMVSIVSLTLLMSASGLDILTGFSAVVASINNTWVDSIWSAVVDLRRTERFPDLAVLLRHAARLPEIFTLLVVMTPSFWRR